MDELTGDEFIETEALRLLDVAKGALNEVKEMKDLEVFMSAGLGGDINVHSMNESSNELGIKGKEMDEKDEKEETKSEAELKKLSNIIEASIPKEQPDEKLLSRMSLAEKSVVPTLVGTPPPPPAPHMEVTPGHISTSNEPTTTSPPTTQETVKRRWTSIRRIFKRNKSKHHSSEQ